MTQIKKIMDKQGNDIYLRTHTKAVVDDNGYTAESRLQAMQDEINQAQLEAGSVSSDLTPTEGSSNWVTSGGLYNELNVGDANVDIDLTQYTAVRAFPNLDKWLVTSDSYPYYGIFIPIEPYLRYRIKANENSLSYYAFLKTNTYSHNATVDYAAGCTRISVPSDTEIIDTAPNDAHYLWVATYTTVDRTPQKIEVYNKRKIAEKLSDIDSEPKIGSDKLISSGAVYEGLISRVEETEILNKTPSLKTVEKYEDSILVGGRYTFSFTTNGESAFIIVSIGDTSKSFEEAYRGNVENGQEILFIPTKNATHWRLWLDSGTCSIIIRRKDITLLKDDLNTRASIEYVDSTKKTIEDEIELSKYNLTEYPDVWSTTDVSAISYEKDGEDAVITVTSKTGKQRCGFSINDVKVGEKIYVDFSSNIGIPFGVGETLSSDWIWLNRQNYKSSFYFTKTSTTQKYIYIAANSFDAGTVIRLVDFKVYKAAGFSEFDTRIVKLESHDFYPSSYIPIKEKYETYMSIFGTQGSTIYGNYFVQGFSEDAKISIYNLETKTKVQDITLPEFNITRFHANTISFSGTKFNNDDDFPLLYICSGYTDPNNSGVSEVYVVRILGESGSYTSELIQTIKLNFGTIWTEFVCDPVRNRAWINGSGIARYICVAIPDITEPEVTIDTNTTIIDKFDTKSFVLGTTTKSSGQGRFFYHNRVYYVSGVPGYAGEGVEALYVVVDNVLTHSTEAVVPLMNFGLTGEPEGCFIWKDEFYVAYRNSIVKLIQN